MSRHIRRIEDELGVDLFHRLPRGVQLTDNGRLFLERCRRIVREVTLAKEDISANAEVPGGRVVFGIPGTLTQTVVPGLVERMRRLFPRIFLRIVEGTTPVLHEGLVSGRLHAAILSNPHPSSQLTIAPLISEPMVVFGPPQHGCRRSHFTLSELAMTPVVVGAGVRRMVDEQIHAHGKRLTVEVEVDSVEAIRSILLRGAGITVLPVSTLREDVEAGRIDAYSISDVNVYRLLALVHLPHDLEASVRAVARAAESEILEQSTRGVFTTIPRSGNQPDANRARDDPGVVR